MELEDATPQPSAPRFLVLHLPAFRLERCGFLAEDVAGLTAERKNAVRLVALTPAARAEGLREEMTATEARARVPGVALEPLDLHGEAEDRAALLVACGRFSDRVFALSETDVVLEVGATAHLFAGERGVLERVAQLASDWGHRHRLALADDPVAARALAVAGHGAVIVPAGGGAAALSSLPVSALFPDDELAQAMQGLGIERIGQWAALDPASIAGRFGERGLRLHRVARGQPASHEPGRWVVDPTPVVAEVVLGGPTVTLAPIHFVLPGLLHQVVETLARRDQAVVRLVLRLVLDSGRTRHIAVSIGRPTRSVPVLERVVRARLENVKLDAPVVELAVEVEEVSGEVGWQPGLVDRTEGDEALPELLARLGDALGPDALFAAEAVSTWLPEQAWRPVPYAPDAPLPRVPTSGRVDPVDAVQRWEEELPCPRPTRLLPELELVEVRHEQGRPLALRTRRGWEPVQRCEGPELLSSGWWRPQGGFERAYWVVQTSEGTMWLFHEQGRWFRHGWFD